MSGDGPTMVWIKWKATGCDDFAFTGGTEDQMTIIAGAWAARQSNAEQVVERICVEFFDDHKTWQAYFGDDPDAIARVRIMEPAEIAGDYHVDLSRHTLAEARKLECPTPSK